MVVGLSVEEGVLEAMVEGAAHHVVTFQTHWTHWVSDQSWALVVVGLLHANSTHLIIEHHGIVVLNTHLISTYPTLHMLMEISGDEGCLAFAAFHAGALVDHSEGQFVQFVLLVGDFFEIASGA